MGQRGEIMSTAHHQSGSSKATAGKPGTPRKRHRLRNLFLAVMALAALVLWQLGPVTHGVASIETGLHQAQGTRSLLAGFIHIAITQIKATLGPLVQQIFH